MKHNCMTEDKAQELVNMWDSHSIEEISKELGPSKGTIAKWADNIHRISAGEYCKPKPRSKVKMKDTIVSMLNNIKVRESAGEEEK